MQDKLYFTETVSHYTFYSIRMSVGEVKALMACIKHLECSYSV